VEIEKQVFPADSPWNAQAFRAELDAGYFYLAAYTEDNTFVGYAGLALLGQAGDLDAELHTIAVDPLFQGQGIGTALMDAVFAHADAVSAPVFLEVRTDNAKAISLYERYGFVQLGVRKNYYQPSGADAFVMRREAAASAQVSSNQETASSGDERTVL